MTLRLKRGTDAQRLAITFEEGELVYTTDTKKLFVGDGTTLGGVPILSSGILDQDVNLNNYDIIGSGDISIDGDVIATRFLGDGSLITGISLDQIEEFNVNLPTDGEALVFNAGSWTNVPLDTQGVVDGSNYRINIVGEDSSLIVDTSTNTLSGNLNTTKITATFDLLEIGSDSPAAEVFCRIKSNDSGSVLFLERKSDDDISGTDLDYGRIAFGRDDINGTVATSIISSTRDYLLIANDPTGSFTQPNFLTITSGKLGIGTFAPAEKLDVRGNGVFEGNVTAASVTASNFVQFSSISTTQRNALTASNGMVIYNSTVERFQGYQNGSWINLDDGTAA